MTSVLDHPEENIAPVDLVGLPVADLPDWLFSMMVIREFEEACEALSAKGEIPGGAHQAVGQEAVAVGAMRALAPLDYVTSGHRPHHHALAKGMDVRGAMAELLGRTTGVVGGRGGSMHLADASIGYLGGNGIVGAGLGLAVGAALSAKLLGLGRVSVGFFGDGAANTGRTWESINLAAIWNLPLIAICENNQYAVQTPIATVMAGTSIADRARGFGLPSIQVDGQDAGAVYRAVKEARERSLSGLGPTFIEAVTYRYHGHNTGEVVTYRTDAEVDEWRSHRDPIDKLRLAVVSSQLMPSEGVDELNVRAKAIVADAIEFARESAWPELSPSNVTSLDVSLERRS